MRHLLAAMLVIVFGFVVLGFELTERISTLERKLAAYPIDCEARLKQAQDRAVKAEAALAGWQQANKQMASMLATCQQEVYHR